MLQHSSYSKKYFNLCLTYCCNALIALALTLLIFCAFYRFFGIYPFGEKSIVWCDMEQQAVPLLLQCKRVLEEGGSLLYHPMNAGGMNFYGIFFFFLSNPFSFLALYMDLPISLLMNLLVPLKLSLASATATIWLKYRFPKLHSGPLLLLSLMYGFCGYGLFYYQNLMWLDVQALLPILFLSLDLLLRKGAMLPYLLTISLHMVLCYYLGYMTVVFLLLAVGLSAIFALPKTKRSLHLAKFWFGSLLGALLTAFVWLPSFLQVMRSARGGSLIEKLAYNQFFGGLYDKIALLAATGIVFGVLPLLWKKSTASSGQEYRLRLCLFVLLFLATVLDPINSMWHTGSYQAFPYRWAYFPILLCLTFAAKLIAEPAPQPSEHSPLKKSELCLLILLPLCALLSEALLLAFAREDMLSYVQTLWVELKNLLLLLIPLILTALGYGIALLFYHRRRIGVRLLTAVFCILFAGECILSVTCYIGLSAAQDDLYTNTVSAADRIDDDRFYRLKLTRKYAHANMVGALGYPTMAHYTSLTREDYMRGVKKMGYSSYWMEVPSTGGTVLTDALWGVRYQLGQSGDFPDWVSSIWTDYRLSIGESAITAPQVIHTTRDPETISELPNGSRANIQAYLAEQKLGLDNLITSYPATKCENLTLEIGDDGSAACTITDPENTAQICFSFFVSGKQALYFDLYSLTGTEIGNPRNESVSVSINNISKERNYPQNSINGLVYLDCKENAYVTVRAKVHKNFNCESFGVFGIQLDPLTEALAALPQAELTFDRRTYTTTTVSPQDGTLILAIPYDEGFSATVNGKSAEVYRVNTCETAVRVPAGKVTVSLHYTPPGLVMGLAVSLLGVFLCLLYAIARRYVTAKQTERICRFALPLTKAAFLLMLLGIYCFPLISIALFHLINMFT